MYCLDFEMVVKSNDNPNFVSNGWEIYIFKRIMSILFLKMCSSDWYNFFQKTWNWILDFISYFTFSIILYFIFVLGVTHVPNPSFAWIKKKFAWIKFLHRHPAPSVPENNVPENRAHLNYVPKVPKMGHKLGTKSAPPQSLP